VGVFKPKLFSMKSLPKDITDPVYSKPLNYNKFDLFLLKYIRDERDLPFIYFTLKILFVLIPFAVLLFTPVLSGWIWWLAASLYVALNVVFFIGRFALMFHCTTHRTLFKKEYDYLNYFLPYFIAPFFGHMADTYYSHHVGMHHAENNLEDDESTTMPYQRDSIRDFLRYYSSFMVSGIYKVVAYFKKRNRKKLMYGALLGQLYIVLFCVIMFLMNWQASLFVFVFPYFFYRFIALFGNWAQHAFIDPVDPGNSYKNSITCINSPYNWQCWNDGYHISHHLKQNLHWTEHPAYFRDTITNYSANNAVVFDEIDFVKISFYLFIKRYDILAKYFVNIGDRFTSDKEIMIFLKERVQRFEFAAKS
jgi:fatty acid desaturase